MTESRNEVGRRQVLRGLGGLAVAAPVLAAPKGAAALVTTPDEAGAPVPEQLHLQFGADAAHEMAVEWAKMRSTFDEKLANRQAVQWMLVDNEIDIRTAKHFTLEAAEKARRGLPFRIEASIAKLTASEGGGRVVDRSMQIHGGMGMTKDLPLERWYREMRIRRVGEGPSEVQRMVIAREILGSNLR